MSGYQTNIKDWQVLDFRLKTVHATDLNSNRIFQAQNMFLTHCGMPPSVNSCERYQFSWLKKQFSWLEAWTFRWSLSQEKINKFSTTISKQIKGLLTKLYHFMDSLFLVDNCLMVQLNWTYQSWSKYKLLVFSKFLKALTIFYERKPLRPHPPPSPDVPLAKYNANGHIFSLSLPLSLFLSLSLPLPQTHNFFVFLPSYFLFPLHFKFTPKN